MKRILISDLNSFPGIEVLTRFRSFADLRVGHLTLLQRWRKKFPAAKFYYEYADSQLGEYFLSQNPQVLPRDSRSFDWEISAKDFLPWDLLQNIPRFLEEDILLSKEIQKWKNKFKPKLNRFEIVGKEKHLYIHPEAKIYPGVVIDTTSGPVIIDKSVQVTSFSFLEGPLYIGAESRIDNARITGGTVIGKSCRIGGEVENSLIQDYSNKHHEGFLGHSVVGSWVNLGALATTSDLKNNYGIVAIQSGKAKVNTGTIKFGSIIGDFAKIGIGVMLNTGCVIDVGSNLISNRVSGYVPPFQWLESGEKYRLDRFIQDTKKIMARRSILMTDELEQLISSFYSKQL
jgi:glucose-1-phosphate thymidylyltransferase